MPRRILKYHLFPEQSLEITQKDGAKYTVYGIDKTIYGEPNQNGESLYEYPYLIALVHAKKPHRCSVCNNWINLLRNPNASSSYYIGVTQLGLCTVEAWGYEVVLCLDCALKTFVDVKVYRCNNHDYFDENTGWFKEAPKLNKSEIMLTEEIFKITGVKTNDKK